MDIPDEGKSNTPEIRINDNFEEAFLYTQIEELRSEVIVLSDELEREISQHTQLQVIKVGIERDLQEKVDQIRALELSLSYRIGKLVTLIPRILHTVLKKTLPAPYGIDFISNVLVIFFEFPALFLQNITKENVSKLSQAFINREPVTQVRNNVIGFLTRRINQIRIQGEKQNLDLIKLHIDRCYIYEGHLEILGWLVSQVELIDIFILINGEIRGRIERHLYRPGVATSYRHFKFHENAGFQFHSNIGDIKKDDLIEFQIVDLDLNKHSIAIPFQVEDCNIQYQKFVANEVRIENQVNFSFIKPILSLVIYNRTNDLVCIERSIRSLLKQGYPKVNLIFINGCLLPEVKILIDSYSSYLHELRHVPAASIYNEINEVLKEVNADYVFFLPTQYELANNSLNYIAGKINEFSREKPPVIYFDEDHLTDDYQRIRPRFKSGLNPDYLLSANYIGDIFLIKSDIGTKLNWLDGDLSQESFYDLLIKSMEMNKKFLHIPKVLAHSRWQNELSQYGDGKMALHRFIIRNKIDAEVEDGIVRSTYRIKRRIGEKKKVSIIIPFRDKVDLLKRCISSIIEKTEYPNYEILLLSNNSGQEETYQYLEWVTAEYNFINYLVYDVPFNYSKLNNWAVGKTKGSYVLFLNNDIEVINRGWLSNMVEHVQREEIGAVGAKLLYSDDTVQHAGVILFKGSLPAHGHKHLDGESGGYMGRINIIQNYYACTGACLLVDKDVFLAVGGFDEYNFKIALNDVDICLKINELGYLVTYTPYSCLYHHESKSRGLDNDAVKQVRARRENQYFLKKWARIVEKGDLHYSPNLTQERFDFSLNT